MTPKEMISLLRKLISDEQATGFTEGGNLEEPEGTQELLNYLDRAVDEYSRRQASKRDVRLQKVMTVSNGRSLPSDFLEFCGAVPLNVNAGVISYYGEASTLPVRYLARLPYVSDYNENATLPYKPDQEIAITALAAIYALNKHEFNVSQDLLLLGYGVPQDGNGQ